VLYEDAVALYRLGETSSRCCRGATCRDRCARALPRGTILLPNGEDAAWVLTSRSPRAVLFGLEGGRLEERQQAAALPWPRSAGGLRYRPGTNLVEGVVADLGDGPFLRLEPRGLALTAEGRLRVGSPDGARTLEVKAGGALARLGSDLIAVPGADPPGAKDAVVLLDARDPGRPPMETLPIEGPCAPSAGAGVRPPAAAGRGREGREATSSYRPRARDSVRRRARSAVLALGLWLPAGSCRLGPRYGAS
jgi:hypothetical protein